MKSQFFSKNALKATNKIGDLLIPGSGEFPSFSAFGCIEHIDDVLSFAPEDDIKSLDSVLGILNFFPRFLLLGLVKWMSKAHKNKGPAGDVLRQLNMGLRGVIFSLYYSDKAGKRYHGPSPTSLIGFDLRKAMN